MVQTYRRFDAAEYLESEEDIAGFLTESTASGDPAVMLSALSTVARARNMSELAKKAQMTREGLYKALAATGNPSFGMSLGSLGRWAFNSRWFLLKVLVRDDRRDVLRLRS